MGGGVLAAIAISGVREASVDDSSAMRFLQPANGSATSATIMQMRIWRIGVSALFIGMFGGDKSVGEFRCCLAPQA